MAHEVVECEVGACYIWSCMIALCQNKELINKLKISDGFVPSCAIALDISNESYSTREIPQNRIFINHI